jgi:hypothetical protein
MRCVVSERRRRRTGAVARATAKPSSRETAIFIAYLPLR